MTRYVSTRAAQAAFVAEAQRIAALIVDRRAYIDAVWLWVHRPLTKVEYRYLRADCGSLHVETKPMLYCPRWRQWIQLRQPSDAALRYLNTISQGDHLINYVEFALDFIVGDAFGAEQLHEFFDTHMIQRWRGKQRPWSCGTTSYNSGKRWVRNTFATYSTRPPKSTSDMYCCHLEWRISKARTMRDIGITSLASLIGFDHRSFWEWRLQLRAIDYGKLGRAVQKTKRRKPRIRSQRAGRHPAMTIDQDEMLGRQIARAAQRRGPNAGNPVRDIGCVQEIMDYCKDRWGLGIGRAIIKLDATPFLPPPAL